MEWNGSTIVDLSRAFLNSNGAVKYTDVEIAAPRESERAAFHATADLKEKLCRADGQSQRLLPEGAWSSGSTRPSARAPC